MSKRRPARQRGSDGKSSSARAAKGTNYILRCFKHSSVSWPKKGDSPTIFSIGAASPLVQLWTTHYKKELTALESVQQRVTRIIKGLEDMSFMNRMKTLELSSLEKRKLRGDLTTPCSALSIGNGGTGLCFLLDRDRK